MRRTLLIFAFLILATPAAAQTFIPMWDPDWQTSASVADASQPTLINIRQIIEAGFMPDEWGTITSVRLAIQRHSSVTTFVITGLSICERTPGTDDCAAAPTRFQLGGSVISTINPFNITAAGDSNNTDALTFTVDPTKDYLVLIWAQAGFGSTRQWDEGSGTNSYTSTNAADESGTQNVSYTGNQRAFTVAGLQAVPPWQPPAITGIAGMVRGDSFTDPLTGVEIVALTSTAECPTGAYIFYPYQTAISSLGNYALGNCGSGGVVNRIYNVANPAAVALVHSGDVLANCGGNGGAGERVFFSLDNAEDKIVYFRNGASFKSCNVVDVAGGSAYTNIATFSGSCGGSVINGMEFRPFSSDMRYMHAMLQTGGVDTCWGVYDRNTATWYTKPVADFNNSTINTISRAANVVSVNFVTPRTYDVGQTVGVSGVTDAANFPAGTYVIAGVTDTQNVTLTWAGANASSSAGTIKGCNAGFDDSNMVADSGKVFLMSNNSNVSGTSGKCGSLVYENGAGNMLRWFSDGFTNNHQAFIESSAGNFFLIGPRPIGNENCPNGSPTGVNYKDGGFKPTGGLINYSDATKFGKACNALGSMDWNHYTANNTPGDSYFVSIKEAAGCNGLGVFNGPNACAFNRVDFLDSGGTPTITAVTRLFHPRSNESDFSRVPRTSISKDQTKAIFQSTLSTNTDQPANLITQLWIAYINPPAAGPTLNSVTPASGQQNAVTPVTLAGTGFSAGGAAIIISCVGVTPSALVVVSDIQITADFTVDPGATLGPCDVSVSTIDGTSGTQTFTVTASGVPALASVTPNSGGQGSMVGVTLVGTNFDVTATIAVSGAGVTASGITVLDPQTITATLTITAAAALGARNVTVTTGAGTSGPQTFSIVQARVQGGVRVSGGVRIQ